MVARPYLRTPRSKIIHAAALVQRKRHEFLTAISKGLVPTDTSPTSRKKRGRYAKELDVSCHKKLANDYIVPALKTSVTLKHDSFLCVTSTCSSQDTCLATASFPVFISSQCCCCHLQEDLRQVLLKSLADIDPANPWVKDPSGRHTNVSALLDWPEEPEDESADESEAMESTDLTASGLGTSRDVRNRLYYIYIVDHDVKLFACRLVQVTRTLVSFLIF